MITLDVRDGVGWVGLDRPPVNAWNDEQLDGLEQVLWRVQESTDIGAVVVRGEGNHFSAGGDIKMMSLALENRSASNLNRFAARIQRLFSEWAELQVPTVAVLRGAATGGGLELALACDLRVAAEDATIGLPEVKLGLLAAGGGTQRLTQLVGPGRALRLLLTGELVDGLEAERLGIVEWCRPAAQLDEHVERLMRSLVAVAGPAHAEAKRCVSLAGSSRGYIAETQGQRRLHDSEQATARIRAFVSEREKSHA